MNEHQLQASIIAECNLRANQDPRYGRIFAIPNGGLRSKATAAKLKAEGVKPGVPDLFLAVPCGRYHGLFLELKAGRGRVSKLQKDWLGYLTEQNYCCLIVRDDADSPYTGVDKAMRILAWYLALEKGE